MMKWMTWDFQLSPPPYIALEQAFENLLFKCEFYIYGALYLLCNKDNPPLLLNPIEKYKKEDSEGKKQLIFIRHAESEWNQIFNRGFGVGLLYRLLAGIGKEIWLLPTSSSIFLDSPLSSQGREEALSLRRYMESMGSFPPASAVITTSNLRRTYQTALLSLPSSCSSPIHLLSCLQEIGRNFDTLALTRAYASPTSFDDKKLTFQTEANHGNKTLNNTGRDRLQSFNQWAFTQSAPQVIVYGHSLWIRSFCKAYMPSMSDHIAQHSKISNTAILSCHVHQIRNPLTQQVTWVIDPASLELQNGTYL